MKRRDRSGSALRGRPWWRPVALSASAIAAIAVLFNPVPALAEPVSPGGIPATVPDTGSRPFVPGSGAVSLPGQRPAGTTPAGTTPTGNTATAVTPIISPVVTDPVMKQVEAGRLELATLGEDLAKLQEDLTLTQQQLATADQKVTDTQAAVAVAEQEATEAAKASVQDAAALPPGSFGSGLQDLDALARIQRGDAAGRESAGRHLTLSQAAHQSALAEQQALTAKLAQLTTDQTTRQAALNTKTTAQQQLEQENADVVTAADSARAAQDAAAGTGYLAGSAVGRSADPRALAALQIALAQRGDPYVWSEEGPDEFDCSGLMYYAYRSAAAGNFPLVRVSRDQYYQTRGKTVDRYSLLPGDLLFFSSGSSWSSIHHVAMYAGDGMMVEAPRTGLDVMLAPVRWTSMFAATRIYGSVEGTVEGPNLPPADPETPSGHLPATTRPTIPGTKPTTKPPTTPTQPGTKPADPGTPTKPSEPGTPTKPSEPGTPTKPSDPSTPPKPSPTKPTKPTPTTKPGDPSTSPKPVTPSASPSTEPSTPATPEETTPAPSSEAPTSASASEKPADASVSASAEKSAEAKQSS